MVVTGVNRYRKLAWTRVVIFYVVLMGLGGWCVVKATGWEIDDAGNVAVRRRWLFVVEYVTTLCGCE
jgi:hypothetical protein